MSLKQRIYYNLLKRFQPTMIGKIKDAEGNVIPNTRIGNTTHLGNVENLKIGSNVYIGQFTTIDASNGVTIEEGCQIANCISIVTHSSHIAIRLYGAEYRNVDQTVAYFRGEVKIGKYTFVGPNTVIMPGTKIGKGSLVSAFSYVKGEFEDFAIIAGNPAKKIGDTRELDEPYLQDHPELKKFYQNWAE